MKKCVLWLLYLCVSFTQLGCSGCDTEAYVVRNPPLLVVGTDLLDFGELPLDFTSTRTIQLANAGQQELVFDSLTIETAENVFMLVPTENTIRGGQSLELAISFTPTEAMEYEAVLKIVSNSQNASEATLTLLGEGVEEIICGDCDAPPQTSCFDEMTLMVYELDGECVEGVCRYVPEYIDCPYGCVDGACLSAPDAGVSEPEVLDSGSPPEDPPTEPSVKMMRMALGEMSTCGVLHGDESKVACWGRSDTLGDGSTAGNDRNVAVEIPNFQDVSYLAAGAYHMCAIKSDDSLWCWGSNSYGQLGDNTTMTRRQPVQVTALENPVKHVAGGRMFTCAVTQAVGENAEVYCWGKGGDGQLGNGQFADAMTPQLVSGFEDVDDLKRVYIGDAHACATAAEDELYCWGWNQAAQCLVAGGENQGTPVNALEEYGVVTVSHIALGYHHSCVMVAGDKVKCWGSDGFGQMDDGTPGGEPHVILTTPEGLLSQTFNSVVSGGHHSCVIDFDLKISCWGFNNYGACGSGDDHIQTAQDVQPIDDPNNLVWRRVYAGKDHTCAIADGYYAYCWGLNSFGQIGDGTDASQRNSPVPVTWE
jgi:alpha-tubulin suppressor-like RCC1 family protein